MSRHDDDKEYASKGVAGAGLGLGIAGTALGLLRDGGGLGGILGCGYDRHGHGGGGNERAMELALIQQREFTAYAISNERRLAGLEACEAKNAERDRKNEKIAYLETVITELKSKAYTDEKTCHKLDARLFLSPNQMCDPYMGQRNVISTHPPQCPCHGGCVQATGDNG